MTGHKFILFFLLTTFVKSQTIYTLAGKDTIGYGGDGGLATYAKLRGPISAAVDANGNVYIVDYNDHRIRKVNSVGIISTFAGTGVSGFSGDGSLASSAQISWPIGIAVDLIGNVYFSDYANQRIRKINTSGIITTIAGTGVAGFSGDGGPAINSQISTPMKLALDVLGNLFIADYNNCRVRKINTSGIITTVAGTGTCGFGGDGGLAINAQLSGPTGLAIDGSGNLYIGDYNANKVRKVDPSGIISTFAGTGVYGAGGDGGPATSAQFGTTTGVAVDGNGNVFIADKLGRIRFVNTSGIVNNFSGIGTHGYNGDGISPLVAQLSYPEDVAVDGFNNVYILDKGNARVREVCAGNCLAGIKSIQEKSHLIIIFPNPNSGSFKIIIDNELKNGQLILINSLGQKVYEQKILQGQNNIITHDITSGLYNYIILQDNGQISNGKLTIE
jgi:hypothetical protein